MRTPSLRAIKMIEKRLQMIPNNTLIIRTNRIQVKNLWANKSKYKDNFLFFMPRNPSSVV